jgi:UDP-N-acetylmuramate dehydrogenase
MTIDRQGALHTRNKAEFVTGYRHVEMAEISSEAGNKKLDGWFIAAWLALPDGAASESEQKIKSLLARRLATQPLNWPNAGSVFRNPSGDYAARLIEACGLKGFVIGGAQVSEKHANFIVNLGTATAADIERLIAHVRETVKREQGVELQQEVRVIGEVVHE